MRDRKDDSYTAQLTRALLELHRQRKEQIEEHRLLKAQHDPAFQRFLGQLLAR